jgi:GNAT superfamily N-acetyltransferase
MNATVRLADRKDAAGMALLLGELGYPSPVAQVEGRITRHLGSEESTVFVAEVDGRIVGFASFHRIPLLHTEGYLGRITALVVAQSHRKQGIGRRLVVAVEEVAWSRSCTRMEVTSGDQRPEAHAFYQSVGYAPDIRRFIKRRGASPPSG